MECVHLGVRVDVKIHVEVVEALVKGVVMVNAKGNALLHAEDVKIVLEPAQQHVKVVEMNVLDVLEDAITHVQMIAAMSAI